MSVFFATRIYYKDLKRNTKSFCNELRVECQQVREHDAPGREWSVKHYPHGYTSYATLNDMHRMSSSFIELEKQIRPHLGHYVRSLDYDISMKQLFMSDCWINIMPQGAYHGLHLHPLSFISGTFYVQADGKSPGIKFEDPRLSRMVAQPSKRLSSKMSNRNHVSFPARNGKLVLFESWLRHEVPMNMDRKERISISFNYSWRE